MLLRRRPSPVVSVGLLVLCHPLPLAVQHECIPHAILGQDILCQAKSGMGKTAVFVLSILQQIENKEGECHAIILCHTRELAFQVRWSPAGGHIRFVMLQARQKWLLGAHLAL